MASYVRNMFKRAEKIIGNISISTSPLSYAIGGLNATVNVLAGTCWINPLGTAAADSTSIKVTGTIDINCDTLSLISDATGATVQIIVWSD